MKLRTQMFVGYAVVFVQILFVGGVSYQTNRSLLASQERIAHSYDIIVSGVQVAAKIADLQAKIRAFLITGDEAYLQRYEPRRAAYELEMFRLKALVSDNQRQIERLDDIELLVASWLGIVAAEIEERRKLTRGASTAAAVAQLFSRNQANTTIFTGVVENKVDAFVDAERDLLKELKEAEGSALELGNLLATAARALAILLGVAAMVYITRRVLTQVGGEPAEIEAATAQIARGDLEIAVGSGSGIAASINELATVLKGVVRQANLIAAGDYSADIAPRSSKDELGIALGAMIQRLRAAARVAESVADGKLDIAVEAKGEHDLLMKSLQRMTHSLRAAQAERTARDWLKTGFAQLRQALLGDVEIETLAMKAIAEIATYLDAQVGAVYVVTDGKTTSLRLLGSYAWQRHATLPEEFRLGEGLVGQAALDNRQILIQDVPEDYVRVSSAFGERIPRFVCITPFSHQGRVRGVVEIGNLKELGEAQMAYLQQAMPALAVAIESAYRRLELAQALQNSQQLAEELQVQQEELRVANEELEEQTQRLQISESRLKTQQEELQVTNEELEEKNEILARQKREVERAKNEIAVKADELALSSKYKSEFLANMSHELRTPLNSLLLLAQGLARNKEGNLSADQVESARVIYSSGSDLHHLINEILDLSKIEAGHMKVEVATLQVCDLADSVRASFTHMAQDKGLGLDVVVGDHAPAEISSDRKRIEQILRNLVANAIKFTAAGGVTVAFDRPSASTELSRSGLAVGECLAISISDTGIGIPAEKHKLIFEAFQQADGGTARQYGGTGLGLTISRELATLLGGEIQLLSEAGMGATFTLYLPIAAMLRPAQPVGGGRVERQPAPVPLPALQTPAPKPEPAGEVQTDYIPDDRDHLSAADKLILLIEDDPQFAAILVDKCHERGFKCLAAPSGEAGLELATRYLPSAVILDLRLPGIDGLAVLSTLKEDTRTRHIPVHVVSAVERSIDLLRQGAVGHAVKPLDHEHLDALFRRLEQVALIQPKRLLVVEDDAQVRRETVRLIGSGDIVVDEAENGEQAMQALRRGGYDCAVVDLKLPDMDGRAMLDQLAHEGVALPPIIVHTARELTVGEERGLRGHAEAIVIKDVRSPERLLDEVSLFLHRVVSQMPEQQQQIIRSLHDSDALLQNKKVLIVDDDMRTMFAVSRLLTDRGLAPLMAENGERALQLLDEQPDVDLVLMDIMMPVMDGYETMRRIRAQARFRKLPIITLTAKAMPEDRQECLEAGANDYLPKPIDADRLFSLMRVWLYG